MVRIARTLLIVIALLWLLCLSCWASATDSVVRLSLNQADGSSHLSGVVLHTEGNRVWIFTNAHGFRDGRPESIMAYPPSHPPIVIDQVDYVGNPDDAGDDLAVVSGTTDQPPPVAQLADASPSVGDQVYLAGYPRGGALDVRTGQRTAVRTSGGDHYDAPADQGMSGGPVFAADGRVCSLMWGGGANAADCYAVPLPRLRGLLQRIRGRARNVVHGRQPRPQYATDPYMQPAGSCGPVLQAPANACAGGVCDIAPMQQPSLPRQRAIPVIPSPPPPDRFRGNPIDEGRSPATPLVGPAETTPSATPGDERGWYPVDEPRRTDPIASTTPPAEPAGPPNDRDAGPDEPAVLVEPVHRDTIAAADPVPATDPQAIAQAAAETAEAGIDWPDLAAKSVVGVAGLAGLAVPTWLLIAWRGARAARRIRDRIGRRRSAEPEDFRSDPNTELWRRITRHGNYRPQPVCPAG